MTIKPSQLSDAVREILEEASSELKEKLDEIGKEAAESGVKELKKTSPKYTGDKKREYKPGAYAMSWRFKRNYNAITGNSSYTIHNRDHYRLTHLLENGHVNRDGSRTRNFIHIAPVNNSVCREYERKIEDAIHDM